MNTYDRGTKIRLSAAFSRVPGAVPADPTTVTLKMLPPERQITDHVYQTDPELIRDDVGRYHFAVVPDRAGLWHYRWEGTGDLQAAAEGQFMVRHSAFD